MSGITITCPCGHCAPFEQFICDQFGRDLPANQFRCPACGRRQTVKRAIVAPLNQPKSQEGKP